jgi:hypothetical protein
MIIYCLAKLYGLILESQLSLQSQRNGSYSATQESFKWFPTLNSRLTHRSRERIKKEETKIMVMSFQRPK